MDAELRKKMVLLMNASEDIVESDIIYELIDGDKRRDKKLAPFITNLKEALDSVQNHRL